MAVDGNVPISVLEGAVEYCAVEDIPGMLWMMVYLRPADGIYFAVWYEPTSKTKATKILPIIRTASSKSTFTSPPIAYISPNIFELQALFSASRSSALSNGAELPSLMSSDAWFAAIDGFGLKTGIAADEFARLGRSEGAWLAKEGIVQMAVQMLPFFQHIIVKCGDRGMSRWC